MTGMYCPHCGKSFTSAEIWQVDRPDFAFEEEMEALLKLFYAIPATIVGYQEEVQCCIGCGYPVIGVGVAQVVTAVGNEELTISRQLHYIKNESDDLRRKRDGDIKVDIDGDMDSSDVPDLQQGVERDEPRPGLDGDELRTADGHTWSVVCSGDDDPGEYAYRSQLLVASVVLGGGLPVLWGEATQCDYVYVLNETLYLQRLANALDEYYPVWTGILVEHPGDDGFLKITNPLHFIPF